MLSTMPWRRRALAALAACGLLACSACWLWARETPESDGLGAVALSQVASESAQRPAAQALPHEQGQARWTAQAGKAAPKPQANRLTYFDARPVRPVRTMRMVVTAYSPDERSCGPNARGITASGYSVWTNGMRLVAADTRLLPFGSLVSIPGYNDDQPVPVLDRGGAIKGHRLDLLMPTHEAAMRFGKQSLTVTVWEYVEDF